VFIDSGAHINQVLVFGFLIKVYNEKKYKAKGLLKLMPDQDHAEISM
jgi:hypothetical protein